MRSPSASHRSHPSVSVVIPARDDAVALERCLTLLARQSVAAYEVIVVDNASTDETAQVARRHGARVVHEATPGIPQAAATGYDAARGDVIARLDADSRPGRTWVSRIGCRMADPRLDAATGTGWFYDLAPLLGRPVALVYLGAYYALCHLALGHTALWGSSMALRRSAWERVRDRVHRDDAELHDDLDLAFVLGPHARIRLDPGLDVGVSARSLHGLAQLRRRLDRAVRTLRLNWADQPPWLRWRDRFTREGATSRSSSTRRAA
ncbi:glycosyltransferase [Nocardioides sp. dk4132]|uniref:glycosyltransferase n=1 Tax=unclassified Nocardioides TaxID=2615069 RepID=UPI001295B56D|nr:MULTISPECIES: glycosyltransferase family 2 protein [unclassified Nocardioides]MQW74807.1 glycosyltransferase [Nocardioides sp. dk4132]QGA06698.1 glycosyltransferase [Nocardioides sp. dk884]